MNRLAYLTFDWLICLIISGIVTAILVGIAPHAWWNIGYVFVTLFFYCMAAILLSYVISMFAKSQLASFALCAGGQA
jgi:ATP-binding cassette, subfamily A (ABC1), member 3